ncbi:MAG: hypothetical protein AAFY71_07020 [Bacteroidota bacterium]
MRIFVGLFLCMTYFSLQGQDIGNGTLIKQIDSVVSAIDTQHDYMLTSEISTLHPDYRSKLKRLLKKKVLIDSIWRVNYYQQDQFELCKVVEEYIKEASTYTYYFSNQQCLFVRREKADGSFGYYYFSEHRQLIQKIESGLSTPSAHLFPSLAKELLK